MSNPRDPFATGVNDPSAESLTIPIEHATLLGGVPIKPVRQEITDVNPYRLQMPRELMRRPGYGKVGDKIRLRLNSHLIQDSPDKIYYQYDVSHPHLVFQLPYDFKRYTNLNCVIRFKSAMVQRSVGSSRLCGSLVS